MAKGVMRIAAIIYFSIFLSFFCFSQGEFNNWYFGAYAGLTFNSGSPVVLTDNPYNSGGCKLEVSVSDSAGNLLFFSAGQKVFDRNLGMMPNGEGLLGGEFWGTGQFIMAVPFITDKNKYYLFTIGYYTGYAPVIGLHYSVLDMQLHGGDGDIVAGSKNIPLYMGDSAVNQLTAIRHHNNRDAWVIAKRHELNGSDYLAYLVTSDGIDTVPVVSQSSIHRPYWGFPSSANKKDAHLRISPDGRFLVSRDSLIEVCLFNSSTGQVIPKFTFIKNDTVEMGGFEFSLDSRYLYSTMSQIGDTGGAEYLIQYDMNDEDSSSFVNNRVMIGDSAGYSIQMAPDGKIYLNHFWDNKYLNVINSPSQPGLSCGYQKNILYFPGQKWKQYHNSLCTFLQRYKAYVHHTGHCVGDSVHFTSDIWPPADSIHWDFGDPASGVSNFSNLANPVHLFSGPGTYTVELWVRHNDQRTDTTWVTIAFPNPQLGPDRTVCTGDSTTFDAGYCAGCTYLWRNLLTGLPVGTGQTYTATTTGIYEVAVTDTNDCTERDTVQLSVVDGVSVIVDPATLAVCSGDTAQ
ncbi:MAG: PKD domain-containing protein, partial [Bacteroidales bacterium]|nr:PKD domain-containing protein [Bacteroidales bacterium]